MASIYNTHKPAAGEGGGLYLKIADGETVKLRIASEPAIYENEFEGQLSTRYGWLVYNQDLKEPQILQQGTRFFKSVAALASDDEWGDPTGYDIKVTRQGTGTDTTYNVTPSANREPLNSEAKEALARVNLIEKLEASPFSQRVMWLSDYDSQAMGAKTAAEPAARPTATPKKDDIVIDDIGSEPINLDDIPF